MDDFMKTYKKNKMLFRYLLQEQGVEEPDVYDTKTFFTSFFFSTIQGIDLKTAIRRAIEEAKDVLENPGQERPPLCTGSYLQWRDEQRATQGLPPITDNNMPQRSAFPPARAHLRWNQD